MCYIYPSDTEIDISSVRNNLLIRETAVSLSNDFQSAIKILAPLVMMDKGYGKKNVLMQNIIRSLDLQEPGEETEMCISGKTVHVYE